MIFPDCKPKERLRPEYSRLTLRGQSAVMMREWREAGDKAVGRGVDANIPFDLAGVLADRLEEYPGEADDDELRLRAIEYFRACFDKRNRFPHHGV